ncbi:MAG TPA: hypothetical protein VG916_10445 [Gemmatimonadaceae bacterium]|nr:hypothetical protein [Gemmatimonadaceae bacterium]
MTRALVLLAAALPAVAGAQDWRTLESSRQLAGTDPVGVRVQYGAGNAEILPASGAWLYRMSLRYDADRTSPQAAFDEAARELRLGTRSAGMSSWKGSQEDPNHLRVELTDRVPLRLAIELGATRADVQLGGLKLSDLDIRTGATEAHVDVDRPNTAALASMSLDVGAADVTVRHGGNLRATRLAINVGVGGLDYEFDGDWTGDIDVVLNVALGKATLRIPAGTGVRVTASTFLADFGRAGLTRRGDDWVSPGYDDAPRHVRVEAKAAFGKVDIVRR